ELLARGAGVVTGAAQLSGAQRSQIRDWVSGGRRLVTPNDDLLAEVGVRRGGERSVDAVTMDGLDGQAVWQAAQFVRALEADGLSPVPRAGGAVVAGTAPVGRGQVLALAVDPLAGGRDGHELLPEAGRLAVTFTGAPAGPARTGAEIYLDPGGLHNGVKGTPQELARRLAGVRAVHIAGWNADYQDPKFNYDYGALIDALHARGVLAYAWLEPPFVSERFWLEHPECREKTATGRDALVDWRRLIALEDATCFRLASPVYSRVVTAYPFDGVDVAELYFEPSRDPDT